MTGRSQELTIGQLARDAGCTVQTIRWYEKEGLLPKAARTAGNQRRYCPGHAARLGFIRHARELGFSMAAIRRLLGLVDHPDAPCSEVHEIAAAHLAEIEHCIRRLTALRDELARMADHSGQGRVADCKVLEVLADHSHGHCLHDRHEQATGIAE